MLANSSVEPQAEDNLIEHQTAHNVLRHLIIADGKRQKKAQQSSSKRPSLSSLRRHELFQASSPPFSVRFLRTCCARGSCAIAVASSSSCRSTDVLYARWHRSACSSRMLEHSQPNECEQIRSLLVPSAVDTLKRQTFTGARILVGKLLSPSSSSS